MKYILIPALKYLCSLLILLINLLYLVSTYIIVLIWDLKIMTWGDLLVCVHKNTNFNTIIKETDLIKVQNELRNEKFWQTMKRWINFEYTT